jgi:hypothetical protein
VKGERRKKMTIGSWRKRRMATRHWIAACFMLSAIGAVISQVSCGEGGSVSDPCVVDLLSASPDIPLEVAENLCVQEALSAEGTRETTVKKNCHLFDFATPHGSRCHVKWCDRDGDGCIKDDHRFFLFILLSPHDSITTTEVGCIDDNNRDLCAGKPDCRTLFLKQHACSR